MDLTHVFQGVCFSTTQKMFPKGESSSYWGCQWKERSFTREYRHFKNVKIISCRPLTPVSDALACCIEWSLFVRLKLIDL